MQPDYYLRRPPLPSEPALIAQFEALWAEIERSNTPLDLTDLLSGPRWPFLAYLAEHKPVLFHGSGNPSLSKLVPRQASDIVEFGNQRAVYAASDGIWPIFYAILEREPQEVSLLNACFRQVKPDGSFSDPHYFFSIDDQTYLRQPWRTGTIYLLPREGFIAKPISYKRGMTLQIMEWASVHEVAPIARLTVGPQDFPFLNQVRSHNLARLIEQANADPEGFPWLE
ncbi:MAG TPA: hypothetical protein DEF47_11805 [Herpetosiphon sp.]|uniref:Uncharacterized protein n=1 Tax=Herpetosiphon aurantiacus (strain ATCC 23779 / DSM 785 / 114-95) TaxID=316274 RepID=A9AWC0_HERA2|nr:hypothetical protein [Herpetosiphon sp.]ABX04770.1 conserved hypothetical protein [Herpetosiphon aurantiacus DSM 785]HBW50580.1 hypothetical protein [Herpetosiphon sp.]